MARRGNRFSLRKVNAKPANGLDVNESTVEPGLKDRSPVNGLDRNDQSSIILDVTSTGANSQPIANPLNNNMLPKVDQYLARQSEGSIAQESGTNGAQLHDDTHNTWHNTSELALKTHSEPPGTTGNGRAASGTPPTHNSYDFSPNAPQADPPTPAFRDDDAPAENFAAQKPMGTNPFATFIAAYRDKPVEFVENVIGATPLQWQRDFLSAAARGERRISIRAGHGVGKSTACAWLVIWHLTTRMPQKCVATAPTAPQLFDALFSEIKAQLRKLPPFIQDLFETTSERIVLKAAPESSFVSARTSSKERPEALAGIHSEHVLLIADEASAIPEEIFEAAAGSMSGEHALTVLIGNPTRNSGLFYQTHHALKRDWFTMHVNCEDVPFVSRDFIKQIASTYGEGSNAYRVRVLGEFSVAEDDTMISAELVDASMVRDVAWDDNPPLVYGLDVARFGDDASVLVKRRGNIVTEIKMWRGLDLMQLTGAVVNEANLDRPAEICVDSIGLGAGVADRLREVGQPARDVNVAESAAMNPSADRLRDDLWLQMRDWLAQRACKLPQDPDLRMDLVSPRFTFTSSGKVKLESKAELKKRLRRSPDRADALALTFASTAALVGGRYASWSKNKPLRRGLPIV